MTFQPIHYGLYFAAQAVHRAQKDAHRRPFAAAWERLRGKVPDETAPAALWRAMLFRLCDDAEAGAQAVVWLNSLTETALDDRPSLLDNLTRTLTAAQTFELVRDHADCSAALQKRFVEMLITGIDMCSRGEDELPLTEWLWLAALRVAAGIVAEDEAVFEAGADAYRQTIDTAVHPEGYFPRVVEGVPEQTGFYRQFRSVQALTLTAESAAHAGVNLWAYHRRGVSVLTAAAYPLYYYFYPEKWPWCEDRWKPSAGLDAAAAEQVFRQHGGFLEMLHPRYSRPLKAIRLILNDLRPIYDASGGGMTTLTHATAQRGLFR